MFLMGKDGVYIIISDKVLDEVKGESERLPVTRI